MSESSLLSPAFLHLPSAGSLSLGVGRQEPHRENCSPCHRVALGTHVDRCHSRPSYLSSLCQAHLMCIGPDFYFFPLPGHPPLIGLLSVQESTHTCPCVGLCGFEPSASESPSGVSRGAVLAAALLGCLDSPQQQPAPAPGRAPHAGLGYLALVHLPKVPEDVQARRGEMRPHRARTHHGGGLGAKGARGLWVSQKATGHRPGPRPPAPRACGPPDLVTRSGVWEW